MLVHETERLCLNVYSLFPMALSLWLAPFHKLFSSVSKVQIVSQVGFTEVNLK